MTALEKLEKELLSSKDAYSTIIGQHILGRFKALGLEPPADKSLKGCLDEVRKKARKQAQGNMAFVEDATVYRWAAEYYGIPAQEKRQEQPPAPKPSGTRHLELDLDDLF